MLRKLAPGLPPDATGAGAKSEINKRHCGERHRKATVRRSNLAQLLKIKTLPAQKAERVSKSNTFIIKR